MKSLAVAVASGIVVAVAGVAVSLDPAPLDAARVPPLTHTEIAASALARVRAAERATEIPNEELTEVVRRTCGGCHSDTRRQGDLSLAGFDVAEAAARAPIAEKMIGKLRAGMMPPPGRSRPGGDTLQVLAATLEKLIDEHAAANPNPGTRTFQRLNRAEYERSIRDLLTLEVDAGKWLPLDTKSANFDNIADVQMPSATLLDAYLDAASEIARLAIGDPRASLTSTTYKIPRLASQMSRVEGAPMGTRGGVSAMHTFPADAEYVFSVSLHSIPTGQLYGSTAPFDEKIEISINGERVAVFDVDRSMSQSDPDGMEMTTKPIAVRAGPQRITAAFIATFEGPVNDLLSAHGHSIADTQIGAEFGITNLPHLRDFVVKGPFNATGVSETPSRRRVFSCRPTSAAEERPCAEKIIADIGGSAYRRPLTSQEVKDLMQFFDEGAKSGGFELGIRTTLEAILASPHFIFRVEELPARARPGQSYPIGEFDLASRLAFFLWGTPPDDSLLAVARRGGLSDVRTLEAQARRLLRDPRSEALASRFASQWLRLQDIEKVHPDALQYPDFHQQLSDDMRRETELFFYSIVRDNRSVLDLYRADYTYLNEALAKHYGIAGVTGPEFRRVAYPDERRSGLLGHASVLTLTSVANRTSPVLRGKWVMEVLLGSPPPPPPPGVPDLDETREVAEGKVLSTRERMEMHRANPTCRSCHVFMDPIGLALDNFDVVGRWRTRENGQPLDTRGELYDGTPVSTPAELQRALLGRPIPVLRTFTQNLMAYGLGRRLEYYDQPTVRQIVETAAASEYRFADFVVGIVRSDAFRQKRVPVAEPAGGASQDQTEQTASRSAPRAASGRTP